MLTTRRAWSRLDLADLDGSFREDVGPRLLTTLEAAQYAAAIEGADYIGRAVREQGIPDAPEAVLRPRSLVGVASDGRPLTGLLRSPLTRVKALVGAGSSDPIGSATAVLDMIVQTQVADAMRAAESVSMTTRPDVRGYVRVVNLPACGRCLVLAGRFYKTASSAGFIRHPRCDCTSQPTNDRGAVTDTLEGFRSMTPAEQNKAFTKAGAQAIRDGADPSRVVNARRGMSKSQSGRQARDASGVYSTTSLARSGRVRLMPESIYELASDQADAVRLLRRFGYVRT